MQVRMIRCSTRIILLSLRSQARISHIDGRTAHAEGLARFRRSRWKHGFYSAEALAESKRVRELLTQSRELLKQMEGD
jgi:hypothetical protein